MIFKHKYIYSIIIYIFFITLFSDKDRVLGYDQCNPCGTGNCGSDRSAGTNYKYLPGGWWQMAGSGTSCHTGEGYPCWYIGENNDIWTSCTCECTCTPVDGGWSDWTYDSWGYCNNTCNQTRNGTRTCTNPSPSCGGAECAGDSTTTETQSCTGGDCCTATSPDSPDRLAINGISTANPTINKSALNAITYSWRYNSNWGTTCASTNKSATLDVKKSPNTAISNAFPLSIPAIPATGVPPASKLIDMTGKIRCNGVYKWSILQSNGEADSDPAFATFTVTGFNVPTVNNFTANKTEITKGESIILTAAAAAESGLASMNVVIKLGTTTTGALVTTIPFTIPGSPTSYSKSFTWTSSCTSAVGTYTAWITTTDKCGRTSVTKSVSFIVNPTVVPTITSLTSNAPLVAGTPYVASENPVTFTATAAGPSITSMTLRIKKDGATSYDYTNTQTCTGTTCTRNFLPWTPACSIPKGDYTATVTATNACTGVSAVKSYRFKVENAYDLTINTYKKTLPMDPINPVCSNSTNPSVLETGVNVEYVSTLYPYSANINSNSDSQAIFLSIPAHAFPVTIDASKAGSNCKSYAFYCIGQSPQQVQQPINIPTVPAIPRDCSSIIKDISIGEEKKGSWETVLNGNIYARNAAINYSCNQTTVGGGFKPTLIASPTPTNLGGYLNTAGNITYTNVTSIFNPKGGFARNLDSARGVSGDTPKSSDAWLNSFIFPTADTTKHKVITSITQVTPANKIYYINGNYTMSTPILASAIGAGANIVYVNGNLTLKSSIEGSTSKSIIFIVKRNIIIDPTLKVLNYTSAAALTPNTIANISATLISLNKTGGIYFNPATPLGTDGPIIISGALISKGVIEFNRNLGTNNSWYPAHIVRYNSPTLANLYQLLNSSTQIETYDVEWVYD